MVLMGRDVIEGRHVFQQGVLLSLPQVGPDQAAILGGGIKEIVKHEEAADKFLVVPGSEFGFGIFLFLSHSYVYFPCSFLVTK